MNEFSLIDTFTDAFSIYPPPRGPGDDCAVVAPQGPTCVTTDAVVEGVHFTRRTFSMEDVGHKALAVNLSDLAAMGAVPTWFTVALGLPDSVSPAEVHRLAVGMSSLARAHGAELVGGNITRATTLSVTVTACGTLAGPPLLRSGAKAGDALYVSGPLGEAAAGLRPRAGEILRAAQRRPSPHLAFGQLARRLCSAGIDVSDGLAQDLGHLCAASGLAAHLDSERIPLSEELLRFARSPHKALEFALRGGEDYVLLVAVRDVPAFELEVERLGFSAHQVGWLQGGEGVHLDGQKLTGALGFQHR